MDVATGKIIHRAKDVKRGQNLRTRVQEGEIFSKVERND
jgi:exonuclease VII large subunit